MKELGLESQDKVFILLLPLSILGDQMLKSIKIRKENYEWLATLAGKLQMQRGRPISIDETLSWLQRKGKLSDFAGCWKMSDKESDQLLKNIRDEWKKWKIGYA